MLGISWLGEGCLGYFGAHSESRRFFLQGAEYTGRREQDVRASESWDMDVTSFAVPYVIVTYGGLLENHGSKKLSTKVPIGPLPFKNTSQSYIFQSQAVSSRRAQASRPALSDSAKRASKGLSMSRTPMTLPSWCSGMTSSELEALSQAI